MDPIMILIEWLKELGYNDCNGGYTLHSYELGGGLQMLYVSIIPRKGEILYVSYEDNNYHVDKIPRKASPDISDQFYPLVDPNTFNRLKNDYNL